MSHLRAAHGRTSGLVARRKAPRAARAPAFLATCSRKGSPEGLLSAACTHAGTCRGGEGSGGLGAAAVGAGSGGQEGGEAEAVPARCGGQGRGRARAVRRPRRAATRRAAGCSRRARARPGVQRRTPRTQTPPTRPETAGRAYRVSAPRAVRGVRRGRECGWGPAWTRREKGSPPYASFRPPATTERCTWGGSADSGKSFHLVRAGAALRLRGGAAACRQRALTRPRSRRLLRSKARPSRPKQPSK